MSTTTRLEPREIGISVGCTKHNHEIRFKLESFTYTKAEPENGVSERLTDFTFYERHSTCIFCSNTECKRITRIRLEFRIEKYIEEQKKLSLEQEAMDNFDDYKRRYR